MSTVRCPAWRLALYCAALALTAGWSIANAQQPPTKIANVPYVPNGTVQQKMDLFVPAQLTKHTALLFIHGGGFKQGTKDEMAVYAYLFAQGGFVAATMDYRLTSAGYVFPAARDDVQAAVGYLKQQAGAYRFDARKIILIGYSAGGNLALMAGLEPNSGVAAIASAAGPTDLLSLMLTASQPQLVIDIAAYLGGQTAADASPINKVRAGNQPVLLFHGALDNLVPLYQSQIMLQKLQQNNVAASLRVLPTAGHEIMLLYQNNPSLKPILDDIVLLATLIDAS